MISNPFRFIAQKPLKYTVKNTKKNFLKINQKSVFYGIMKL